MEETPWFDKKSCVGFVIWLIGIIVCIFAFDDLLQRISIIILLALIYFNIVDINEIKEFLWKK